MNKNSGKSSSVRIIAGEWRGRKVSFTETDGLRPTSDRVRETLFNWLQAEIETLCCLDLFAGSGALGIEALSRGAKKVCFIELDNKSAKQISQTLEVLQCENAELINIDAERFLETASLEQFGMIFLDPPYKKFTLKQLATLLEQKFSQNQRCKIFYEFSQEIETADLPANWTIEKKKKAGKVFFYLITRKPA